MANERCDAVFANLTDSVKGVEDLLESFFGFLARRTDFYTNANAKKNVTSCFDKWKTVSDAKFAEMAKPATKTTKTSWDSPQSVKQSFKATSHPKVEEVIENVAQDNKSNTSAAKHQDLSTSSNQVKSSDNAPPFGNGGDTDLYNWTQTLTAVDVYIPLKSSVKAASQCKITITATSFKLVVTGETIIDKEFSERVKTGDTFWLLEDGKVIHLVIEKYEGMRWWSCVFKGDPEIDTKKIQPENSKLGDLDPELRQTVEKMMFDQDQKARGLPTSDQLKQAEILEQFKKQHPEMDFSSAKINWGGSNSFSTANMN